MTRFPGFVFLKSQYAVDKPETESEFSWYCHQQRKVQMRDTSAWWSWMWLSNAWTFSRPVPGPMKTSSFGDVFLVQLGCWSRRNQGTLTKLKHQCCCGWRCIGHFFGSEGRNHSCLFPYVFLFYYSILYHLHMYNLWLYYTYRSVKIISILDTAIQD